MPLFGSGHEIVTSTTRPSTPVEGQVVYETDTDRLMVYNGSSWRLMLNTLSNQLSVGATRTGSAAAITESPIKWNNILTACSSYNATTGLYTAPLAGTYLCSAQVLSNVPNSCYMYIQKNGTDVCFSHMNVTGTWVNISITNIITCAVNDTIGFRCNTTFYGNDHNSMCITYLGV